MIKTLQYIGIIMGFVTVIPSGPGLTAEPKGSSGAEKVMLMLGGKFCDRYPEDVERALNKVPGVKQVDLRSMPGHAVVEVEPGKAKPDQLVAAINGVKGSGWHCTGQVMK